MTEAAPSLATLLRARSIALVGATERSSWARSAYENLRRMDYAGRIVPVNPSGAAFFDLPSVPSCGAIEGEIDVALLMVPSKAIPGVIGELAGIRAKNAILLSSGFAETGEEGVALQRDIVESARRAGMRLLGPNCLGFVNFTDGVAAWTTAVRDVPRGSIAIVSQSGATASYICRYAAQQQVGLSAMVSTGNEGDLGVADALDHFAADPATKVIILFIEAVRDAAALRRAALSASRNGKPVVVLKVGSSEATAKVAQAHTGSIVGDDRVFSAACRALGMIRVRSVEEAVATAALLDSLGPLGEGGLAAMAISGGICEVVADAAETHGVELCAFSDATRAALASHLPDFGTSHNPLDLTGAAVLKPDIFEGAARELVAEPSAALAAAIFDMPEEDAFGLKVIGHIGHGFAGARAPGVVMSIAPKPVSPEYRAQVREAGVTFLGCGLDVGLQAIRNAFAWSRRRVQDETAPKHRAPATERPATEPALLQNLARRGVSVVPGEVVTDSASAAAAARQAGGPVAMKIVSPQIAHKSDIGGVRLNVAGVEAAEAFDRIIADCAAARPDATLEGVVVSPMRERGVELFVGVTVDPQWGPTLALGLGGVWIELLKDTSLRLLPVSPADIVEMLGELKAARLLHGYRGSEAVDIARLADEIGRIADAALDMMPGLQTLEINPLSCRGGRIEALDALAEWSDPC